MESLPEHVLEEVLGHLGGGHLATAALVNSTFLRIADRVAVRSEAALWYAVDAELRAVRARADLVGMGDDVVLTRLDLLRTHFVLEMIRCEMSMVRALTRRSLPHPSALGPLTEELWRVFYKSRARGLPAWQLNDDLTAGMLKMVRRLLDRKTFAPRQLPLGITVTDLIHGLLLGRHHLSVSFSPVSPHPCTFTASYKLIAPQYLNRPPRLVSDDEVPTTEDAARILNFLVNMVRINNRVALREEMYCREMEAASRNQELVELEVIVGEGGWLNRPLRAYHDVLPSPLRTFFVPADEVPRTAEEYISSNYPHPTQMITRVQAMQGFSCTVTGECNLEDAPLWVGRAWDRLYREANSFSSSSFSSASPAEAAFFSSLKHHSHPQPSSSRTSLESSSSESGRNFKLNCVLEVTMMASPTEVEAYTLRFKEGTFTDSASS